MRHKIHIMYPSLPDGRSFAGGAKNDWRSCYTIEYDVHSAEVLLALLVMQKFLTGVLEGNEGRTNWGKPWQGGRREGNNRG